MEKVKITIYISQETKEKLDEMYIYYIKEKSKRSNGDLIEEAIEYLYDWHLDKKRIK